MTNSSKRCISPFIETICLIDAVPQHLDFHQQRMDATWLYAWGVPNPICLQAVFARLQHLPQGTCKYRIVYDRQGIVDESCSPYQRPHIKRIKLVVADEIRYPFKSALRAMLTHYKDLYPEADDVLFVKNGLLTDTSFCHIALSDGKQWVTPHAPLLWGTTRRRLIQEGKLTPKAIRIADLPHYTHIMLFNALNDFGQIILPISAIY